MAEETKVSDISLQSEDVKPSKSQLKKLEKQRKLAEKKALKTQQKNAEESANEAKRLEEAKSIVIKEDESLPKAILVRIENCRLQVARRIQIFGWVHFVRKQGALLFLELRDGSGLDFHLLQVVLAGDLAKTFDAIRLFRETSIMVKGVLVDDARAKGGVELQADYWEVVGYSSEEIENRFNTESNPDVLLDNRHLHLRSTRVMNTMKMRSIVTQCLREFFFEQTFFEVTPPTLVQTQVEGGSDLFKLKYFNEDAYLTQSSQLYLETAIPSMGRVFCILPSYRAELSKTRRHLSEFTHVEGELAFISYDDLMNFIEDMVVSVSSKVMEKAGSLVKTFNPDFAVPQKPFLRMSYREALEWLKEHNVYKESDDPDVKEHYEYPDDIPEKPERFMTDTINRPIFLHSFPVSQKPFYMSRSKTDQDLTESVDLLMPGVGEIVGGSMREWVEQNLLDGYKRQELSPDPYYWYNEQRTFGTCPHGGFGLGLERFLCWMLNQFHVRDVCLYPRFYGRCQP